MTYRATIESLTAKDIISPEGPSRLAEVGSAMFVFAQRKANQEEYGISRVMDLETRKPIVAWSRLQKDDRPHILTASTWDLDSYVLYDILKPDKLDPGYLRVFLFGNDSAVSGLEKGMKIMKLRSLKEVPGRVELQERIERYSRHPSSSLNRTIKTQQGANIFASLTRSLVVKDQEIQTTWD
jgi:hypothetical protein